MQWFFYSSLTKSQIKSFVRFEKHVISIITSSHANNHRYISFLNKYKLSDICKRFDSLLLNFGKSLLSNVKYRYLLPNCNTNGKYNLRKSSSDLFKTNTIKCNRYAKSTFPNLVKKLNIEF